MLGQCRRADGEVAGETVDRALQSGGHQQPAQPPPRHREILREAVDHNGVARRLPRAAGLRGARIDQAVVDLVADQPHAGVVTPYSDGGQLGGRYDGAGRVGRAGDDHARYRGIERLEHRDGRLEPGLGAARDLDHLAAQRGEDVAVTGITRAGDRHPVTDVEAGQERQQESTGGSGGEHHLVDADLDAVLAVRRGDLGAQLGKAERDGVAELAMVQRGDGGVAHRRRCPGTGLPGGQVDQVAVCALAFGRGQPHVHDVKWRDSGS